MIRVDYVVIGAGAVGLSVAYALQQRFPEALIAVIEKNMRPGLETSLLNSGVIHSGLHLDPSSKKAYFARTGKRLIHDFCIENEVPWRNNGMIIVGNIPTFRTLSGVPWQLHSLYTFRRRAQRQGISTNLLLGRQIMEHEPAIHAFVGLHVPGASTIDTPVFLEALFRKLYRDNEGVRARLLFGSCVERVEIYGKYYHVSGSGFEVRAKAIVNAAGLCAHNVAALAGHFYSVEYVSGEYYRVSSERAEEIGDTLIYPAIAPGSPGLGIHITRKHDGRVYLGPNAQASGGPVFDVRNRTPPEVFIEAVRPFWPTLRIDDIEWAFAGMRVKAKKPTSDDFIIDFHDEGRWIDLVGVESPGLTSSLALGEFVAQNING